MADGTAALLGQTPEDAARRQSEQAAALTEAGDHEAALLSLDKAVFLTPEDPRLYEQRAMAYCALGDVKSALASFRKLVTLDLDPPIRIKTQFAALLDLHAYSLLTAGEAPNVAASYVSEAIALDALRPVYWLHRALAHLQAGNLDKALTDIDHCICLDNRDVEYFVLRAKLHWRLHLHDKATRDIARAAKLQPDHPEVIEHERRLQHESQSLYEAASRDLLGRKPAQAIEKLSKSVELAPDEPKFFVLRAVAHRALGDLHVALKDVDRALSCHRRRLNADHSGLDTSKEYREIATQRCLILNDLAQRFLREQSFQLALNAMNQVIPAQSEIAMLAHEPFGNAHHFQSRGDAHRGLGNLQAALADYHSALEVLPDNADIKARIAHVHYSFGIQLFNGAQFDKAELEFGRAVAFDSRVAAYVVRRGDAARYQEKHQAACADYLRALELDPSDQDTRDKLRQYAVDPPSSSNQRHSEDVDRRPLPASSPGHGVITAHRAKQKLHKVDEARRAYERKNRVVQELFLHRPSLPPPSVKKR